MSPGHNGDEHVWAYGYDVSITRSDGADGAVVIFVDGPDFHHDDDVNEDGSPKCRVLLNDNEIYRGTAYVPR